MKDDSWLSAEHAYFITKGIQKKNQTNPEAYNQEIQRFVDLYKQYKGQQGVAEDLDGSREYRGLVMSVAEGEDGFKLTAHSPAGKKLGWVEFSYDLDGNIRAEELEVDE
ncbi:MAG: hypothetical protein ACK55Z_00830, partial [bacterium]